MKKIYLIVYDESQEMALRISNIIYALDKDAKCKLIKNDENFIDVFYKHWQNNDRVVFLGHPNFFEGAPSKIKEKVDIIFDHKSYEGLKRKIADYIKK